MQELLLQHPAISIIAISFFISLLTLIVAKYFTNQKELKRIREETKKLQKELKKVVKTNPNKAKAIQKQIMDLSMQSMRHSFRVTIITLIPLLLIFGWLRANMGYIPIQPNQTIQIDVALRDIAYNNLSLIVVNPQGIEQTYTPFIDPTRKTAKFLVKFPDYGLYSLKLNVYGIVNNSTELLDTATRVVLVDKYKYKNPEQSFHNPYIKSINIKQQKLYPLGNFSILGYKPGWFAMYFAFSLIFILLLKKLLKVY